MVQKEEREREGGGSCGVREPRKRKFESGQMCDLKFFKGKKKKKTMLGLCIELREY